MQTNDLLRWTIVFGVLLILFIPLFVADTLFFPFITGKGFAFRIIVEIIFALWLILALRDPAYRPKKSLLLYAIGAFVLVIGMADIFGANPVKSLWSNFERMEGWVGLVHLSLYFLVIYSFFITEKWWKIFWNTAIIASVIQACYGVLQLLNVFPINQGGVRVDGRFGNATYLAIYMLFSFFITVLAYLWWGRERRSGGLLTIGYAIAALLQFTMIFYTATRGAILGLLGGVVVAVVILLIFEKGNRSLRKWSFAGIVALLVLWGGFIAVKDSPFVQNNEVLSRLAGVATPSGLLSELGTRTTIWNMAWKGFLERPILGWGQEDFNFIFNKYYDPSLYGQEAWFDRAHDEFLDWLVAGGAVGFLIYLSFFAIAFCYLWRKNAPFTIAERGVLTGLLVGYAINNLVVFDNLISYIYFFSILAYITYRSTPALSPKTPSWWSKSAPAQVTNVAAPLVAVVAVLIVYLVNVPGISAASDLIQSLSRQSAGITANFDYFKKAVADASAGLGRQEVREQLIQFALDTKKQNAGNQSFQVQVGQYASNQMNAEIAGNPNDARLRMFYGSYLYELGDSADAKIQLTKAHNLSPNKQQILFELAGVDVSEGNTTDALALLKQAYDSAPDYDLARTMYAGMAIQTGNMNLASSLLLPRYGTLTPDDNAILSAYLSIKDYQSVLSILKDREEKNQNDYQSHVQLGAAYLQEGDRADAIAQLRQAIQLNPSFQQQGQYYINQIQSGKAP